MKHLFAITTIVFGAACASAPARARLHAETAEAELRLAREGCELRADRDACREYGQALVAHFAPTERLARGARVLKRNCLDGQDVASCRLASQAFARLADARNATAVRRSGCLLAATDLCQELAVHGDDWGRRQLRALCARDSARNQPVCSATGHDLPEESLGDVPRLPGHPRGRPTGGV